ncbi:TONSL protein, partial [Alcedo cyanopectus]|nr:TONSL protein [Ceyx cyanopectus]
LSSSSPSTELQKAKAKAQRSGNLQEEATVCNQLGEILASHGRYEEALEEHRQELGLLEGAGDKLGCAVAHRKIGERWAELENYEEALKHQHQHLELARSLADDTEQQRAWATIGRTYMFIAESRAPPAEPLWDLARDPGVTGWALAGSVPGQEVAEMRTRLYLNLGLVYDGLGQPAQRDQYIGKSVFLAERHRLLEDQFRAYFNLGAQSWRGGDPRGALRGLARARDCARRLHQPGLESDCAAAASQVLLSLGDFVAAKRSLREAHRLQPPQPSQQRLLRSLLRYATKVTRLQEALEEAVASDPAAAVALCEQLGDTFSKRGDFARAIGYYQRQLSLAQALGRPPKELAVIHVSLATTFGDLRDHQRALHHYQQELALHQGDALEEGKTWLNVALAMEGAGESPHARQSCLRTALQRAQEAGDTRLQRQILRHLHALQLHVGDAEAAASTKAELEGLGGPRGGSEEEEEEEEEENSEAQEEESELELSESGEGVLEEVLGWWGVDRISLRGCLPHFGRWCFAEAEEELEGYSKSVPGRRRVNKWNRRNERGETPLHRACIEGDLRRARLLLTQGHPLNTRDYCGWTPLHEACNHGHLELVRLLLDRGAALDDPGGAGCEGITPLHDALSCGHFEVAELLVQRGASVNARNAKGLTPLGTLEEWARAYGPELDQETRQRCRDAQKMLKEAAAAAPARGGDSGQRWCWVSMKLLDGDLVPPNPFPVPPNPFPVNTKFLSGGTKSFPSSTKSLLDSSKSLPSDAKLLLGSTKSLPKSLPGGTKSFLFTTKSIPGGTKSFLGIKSLHGITKSFLDGTKSLSGGTRSFSGTTKSIPGGTRSLFGATKPHPASLPAALCQQPALIPEEQYLAEEDWLEDDLGGGRGGRKRPRRDPRDPALLVGDSSGSGSDGEDPAPARHRRHRRHQQSRTGGKRSPVRPQQEGQGEGEEEDEGGLPTPLLGSLVPPVAPVVPVLPPTLRVRVRVQDSVFLIPVPQRGSPPRAVGWLAGQAAERFYQQSGLRPRLALHAGGALLAPQDPVADVLHSNEEVLGEVQGWDLPPLAERYRQACQSLALEPHQLLLKVLELQEQSPGLGVGGGLALRPPHLPPLLRALKLQAPLRQLRLRGCGLSDTSAADLLATLVTLPALTLLDLAGNHLGAQGLRELLPQPPGTARAFQNLEELDLSLNPLGDSSCRPLAELLRHCPALTTLRLDACSFTDAFALHAAAQLQTLTLSCNTLGPAALERLFSDLPARSLCRLELGSATGLVVQPLGTVLRRYLAQDSCALSHLTLSGNHLVDSDVQEVARCLPLCLPLVSLDFSANPGITVAGLWALLSALEHRNQGLHFLSLAG